MKRTLLDIVQSYLNSVSGFEVDSIHDTTESYQVAVVARDVYMSLTSEYRNLQFSQSLSSLIASGSTSIPTHMTVPEGVHRIDDSIVRYKREDGDYYDVQYLEPQDFISRIAQRTLLQDDVLEVPLTANVEILVYENSDPTFCTSIDGKTVIFDSYDKERESTLQSTNSLIIVNQSGTFLLEDDFVIPLPADITELYLDMVKAEASEVLLQEPMVGASMRARSGKIRLQQDNRLIGNTVTRKPRYGRRS